MMARTGRADPAEHVADRVDRDLKAALGQPLDQPAAGGSVGRGALDAVDAAVAGCADRRQIGQQRVEAAVD